MRSVARILCGLVAVLALLLYADSAAAAARHRRHPTVRAMNAVRAQYGLPPLRWSRALARAARSHSRSMARTGVFAHGAFAARLARFTQAPALGENLAWLSRCDAGSPRRVVAMWLNSPPHREILLSSAYRHVGIGWRLGRVGTFPACLVTADFSS